MPDDTPFYPHLNAFSPGRDDLFEPADQAELCARVPNPRKKETGNPPFVPGFDGVHGDYEDFLCLSPLSKFSADGRPPADPCGESFHLDPPAGMRLGGLISLPDPEQYESGLHLGGILEDVGPPETSAGLHLGGILTRLAPRTPEKKAGLHLGGALTEFIPACDLLLETGDFILLEDGSHMLLEECLDDGMLLEDGFFILLEDGSHMLLED